jgi:hypothetical protein
MAFAGLLDDPEKYIYYQDEAGIILHGDAREIDGGIAVQQSNALLMAASPTLLEACQEALRMVRNCTGNWQIGVTEKLERAIKRATEVHP